MVAKYKVFVKFVADAVKFRRSKLAVNAQEDGRIPWGTKLPYALPQFSLTSLTMLIGIHGTLFYTKVGADVAFIAFFTALARSFDVVTDPVMGYFSDKTRTKHGRRRPYMLGACPFYALCFILLFSPPAFESTLRPRALWRSTRRVSDAPPPAWLLQALQAWRSGLGCSTSSFTCSTPSATFPM